MLPNRSGVQKQGCRPASTRELSVAERTLLTAIQQLGFGRFEFVRIRRGELVLDPWPKTVQTLKFGSSPPTIVRDKEFELKEQVSEFFEYVRGIDDGEIRTLEIRHGLPFSMEIDHRQAPAGAC